MSVADQLRGKAWYTLILVLVGCGGGGGGGSSPAPAGEAPAPMPVGLARRPDNPLCVAPPRPGGSASVSSVDAFPASPGFSSITKILQAPGDASRWFVVEQPGRVRVFDTDDPANPRTWINVTDRVDAGGEKGLLGMAFHPNFPRTTEVYLYYSAGRNSVHESRVVRLVLDDPDEPQAIIEEVLLTIDQPYGNHNGGDIAFGPDRMLYVGLGDGGSGGDPDRTGQDTTKLLGSMLRIDVLGVPYPSPAYRIPPDNPFASEVRCGPTQNNASDCPEIYAWGLRNPWRWSFDSPTGRLWLGDVGQSAREEINLVERGGNYGWNCREGKAAFPPGNCSPGGLIDPVIDYGRDEGQSVTGGFVYRGSEIPELIGRYVFADYLTGRIWALAGDDAGGFTKELLTDTDWLISAFALDQQGELYFADRSNGRLRKLAPAGPETPDNIPDDLADTGCVAAADPTLPAAGLVPYAPNAPFWSDGADKRRWLALPNGSEAGIGTDGDIDFPNGTVLVKDFSLNGRLIETRLLMRHPDGAWAGYTYEWNDAQTAATRVRGGRLRQVDGQTWIYPSEGDCLICHTSAAGFSLGAEILQLNGELTYPSTGRTANQLRTLEHIGYFDALLPAPVESLPAMPDPADATAPLADRARAYLHTNCSQCHRPGGPTPSNMDLRYETALADMNVCNAPPAGGDLDLGGAARLVVPGDASRSVLPGRMNRRDVKGMPPLGSSVIDGDGVALVDSWIDSLAGCD